MPVPHPRPWSGPPHRPAPARPPVVVPTSSGRVRGEHDGRAEAFLGIPYAAPPVGKLRFLPPARVSPWPGTRDARSYGPTAPQNHDAVLEQMFGRAPSAHDEASCLTLNLWTPQSGSGRRPVLVWIHGGGFLTGAGSDPVFDGGRLAERHDVVVVTLNHRLGALGFLHLAEVLGGRYASSGNVGLLDQRAALTWVRDEIAAFGGDPGNVTLFGQSAGAFSVVAHLASPGSAGLFHKAIVQSGSGEGTIDLDQAGEVTRAFLDELGVAPHAAAELLTRPAADLLRAQEAVTRAWQARGDGVGLAFVPHVDGEVLPRTPLDAIAAGAARRVPLLLGTNRDEGRMFTVLGPDPVGDLPEEALTALFAADHADPGAALDAYRSVGPDGSAAGLLAALIGERLFGGPTGRLAEAQAACGGAVWRYRFDWASSAHEGRLGACHSLELPFVFDNLDVEGVDRFTGPRPPQELADVMSCCWARFARIGDPGLWPRYEPEGRQVMLFDRVTAVARDPDRVLRLLARAQHGPVGAEAGDGRSVTAGAPGLTGEQRGEGAPQEQGRGRPRERSGDGVAEPVGVQPGAAPHHGQHEQAAEQPPPATAGGRHEQCADQHDQQRGAERVAGGEGAVVDQNQRMDRALPVDGALEHLHHDHAPAEVGRDEEEQ